MNEAVREMVNTAGVIKCPGFILCTSLKYFGSVNLQPSVSLWKWVPVEALQPGLFLPSSQPMSDMVLLGEQNPRLVPSSAAGAWACGCAYSGLDFDAFCSFVPGFSRKITE